MQVGDKVTVVRNPQNSDDSTKCKSRRTSRNGVIESISNNIIVVMYRDKGEDKYRESFNAGSFSEDSNVEILDKHGNKITLEEFRRVTGNKKGVKHYEILCNIL